MHHAGDWAVRTVANVRSRACDCAGGRESPKQGRENIGDTLSDEFLIRIVLRIGHAVGYRRRQQRFNCAQQRDRKGRPNQLHDGGEIEQRKLKVR